MKPIKTHDELVLALKGKTFTADITWFITANAAEDSSGDDRNERQLNRLRLIVQIATRITPAV